MGAEETRHYVREPGDDEQVQPSGTERKSETWRPAVPYAGREHLGRDVGVLPRDTGQPWERQSRTREPPSPTGCPVERIQDLAPARSSGSGQMHGTGRPWETMPGREVIGTGQIPGTGRPWETMPGRELTRSAEPGQTPGTGRPWETMPGREVIGTGQIPGTGRPWETMPGREVIGTGQIPVTGRPWETMPGREAIGTGQIPVTGRPWETMPGREVIGTGQMPGTGRPWETMPRREVIGTGQIPGEPIGEPIPGTGTSGESRTRPTGAKRETNRERLLRERNTVEGQIEDAKGRLNRKMVEVENEIKALNPLPISDVKKQEMERNVRKAKAHFLEGVQNVNQSKEATFGRLLKKIEEIEDPRIATSRMDWEELDDLLVNMMMFYSELLSELDELEKQVNSVKRSWRSAEIKTAQGGAAMAAAPGVPVKAVALERSSSLSGPNEAVTIDENGGFCEFSNLGLFLHVPPNAVSQQTSITCKASSKQFLSSPAGEMETVVSHIVDLRPQSLRLQQPIVATLLHSGPGREYGYETIVKAFNQEQLVWVELKEYKSAATQSIDYIRVKITKLTVLAVVSRLIKDQFELTPKGSLVRSSVCDDIILQFTEGAVTRNVNGSLQVLMIPKEITTNGYPCPIVFVNGFEGINFRNYVLVRIPHPCPSKYPVGQINLMCLKQNQWTNITDQTDRVICVEQQHYIEFHVQHFSGLWPWLLAVPCNFIELFRYLCQSPQAVCFAAFKQKYQSSLSPKITLLCVANHDDERILKMRDKGYGMLACTTARKKMRPNDNAFVKLEGEYQARREDQDIFLQFLYNESYMRELSIERKQETIQVNVGNAVLLVSFYPSNEFAKNGLICKLDVQENITTENYRPELLRFIRELSYIEDDFANLSLQQLYNEEDSDEGQENQISDIISSFGPEEKLLTISAEEVAHKLPRILNVTRSVNQENPPPHIMKQCRIFCRMLKELGRKDIVDALRRVLPEGMTGPVSDGNTLVENLESDRKRILTRHLSVTEKWKPLAQQLGATPIDIQFFEAKTSNHSMAILKQYGKNLTVNQLYKLLVRIGANAIADHL